MKAELICSNVAFNLMKGSNPADAFALTIKSTSFIINSIIQPHYTSSVNVLESNLFSSIEGLQVVLNLQTQSSPKVM